MATDRIVRYTHYDIATGSAAAALEQAFAYDALGRLTGASVNGVTWTFSYDANGNRLAHSAGGTTRNYTVSTTSNRLLALDNPARTFVHDAMGNVTSDNETIGTAVYDLSGRLASVNRSGATALYSLNAMGQRVRKDSNSRSGERLIFAYDQAGHLLGEYDYTGKAVREYVWMGDTPVAVFTPGAVPTDPPRVYAIHADHLDAPRVVVDSDGGIRWRWLSDPFGVYVADEDPVGLGAFTLPLRFPGQYFDRETGLHYNWNRDYDGLVGRYIQSDPIGLNGGINTYAYVSGDPVSRTDPRGLFWSPEHIDITMKGAERTGMAPSVAWQVAYENARFDFLPGNQEADAANWHAMTQPGQDPSKAEMNWSSFIEYQTNLCTLRGLGWALHALQDSFAGGHSGFHRYAGVGRMLIDDPLHIPMDMLPASGRKAAAIDATRGLIKRWVAKCSCQQ